MKRNKNNRHCFFLDWSESRGAAKNRLLLNQKGFSINSFNISYGYILHSSSSKFIRYIGSLYNLIKVCLKILTLNKNDILYIYGPFYFPFILDIAIWKKVQIFIERTEYPASVLFSESKYRQKQNIEVYKKADVFVTCSEALKKYYSGYIKEECKFFIIPVLVDVNIFPKSVTTNNFITYCGYMGGDKDGVKELLQSYHKATIDKNKFKLCLIGDAPKSDIDKIKVLIKEFNLQDNVILTGRLSHKETVSYLSQSVLNVLARPANKQAEGGFPSKLGEYLATGKPSLVTAVGDIPKYIKDGENGYIVEPNVDAFAKKIDWIIDNLEEAKLVGIKGKKFIEDYVPDKQIGLLLKNINEKL